MSTVRRILFTAPLVLAPLAPAFAPPGDELAFAPEGDSSVQREISVELAFYLDDLRVLVDGQEMPIPVEGMDSGILLELVVEVADRFVESRDGRALEMVRTYEKVSVQGGPEGETKSLENAGKIVDKPIRFRWDAEDSEYEVTWADEDARGDDELLEGLHADMDFTMLLPDGEVSVGDTWSATGPELAFLFFPGGVPGSADDGGEIQRIFEDTLEPQIEEAFRDFEVLCTYRGLRTEGETRVGEITFAFDGGASLDLTDLIQAMVAAQGAGEEVELDVRATLRLEVDGSGTLLWNVADQRAHSLSMGSEMVLMLEAEADITAHGDQTSGELTLEVSGNGEWRMTTR